MSDEFQAARLIGLLLFGQDWRPARQLRRDRVGGFVVSTVLTYDQGWEMAILGANGARPVQRYDSEDRAEEGHAAWLARLAVPPATVLQLGGLGGLVEDEEVVLKPMLEEVAERLANA